MSSTALDTSRAVLVASLLRGREQRLAAPTHKLALVLEGIFMQQMYTIAAAVSQVETTPQEGDDALLARLLAAVTAALATRDSIDRQRLRDAYEPSLFVALRTLERRFGVHITLEDIDAARWSDWRSLLAAESVNQTTVERLGKPLSAAVARTRDRLALTGATVVALGASLGERAAFIASVEALCAYGFADLAGAALFDAAGIAMLKEWHHTDGCPCVPCNLKDRKSVV